MSNHAEKGIIGGRAGGEIRPVIWTVAVCEVLLRERRDSPQQRIEYDIEHRKNLPLALIDRYDLYLSPCEIVLSLF